ncbi:putative oxidoreductase YcjS [Polystyrenella longa]|uniref:Putative oxidoreductase YcjS n=1 Tax=Polystyrenella longa TaxID=2528007 RepID=A0A518CJM3_9PLAN|nr:Gfo/Idh/MocA family oxidoreductase [Polystyrenella longa]QDU79374.1 putative oxidoreductase YcjS [Polystyrenella longa]
MSDTPLRYGIIGGGFITGFQLKSMLQVRGLTISGITSRRRPETLSEFIKQNDLGPGTIYDSIEEMLPHVDVVAIFGPNFTRVETVERIVNSIQAGTSIKAIICEKPLGRNLQEARKVIELAESVDLQTIYFENQLHMGSIQAVRDQLAPVIETMGPPVLTRSSEEHAGPHSAWFWTPSLQGGGVMSDMGCHCLAVGWYTLTPPGKPVDFLKPVSVQADLSLLKWGQPRWREQLKEKFDVDFSKTPAEDFATGIVTYENPETGQRVKSQFTVSWMYDKQGLRLALDGLGASYAFEMNTLRSPLEIFIGDEAAASLSDAETALEKSTATRGLLAVQPNEPDLYGYNTENEDAIRAIRTGAKPLLDWNYGLQIVRLTMAAYLSAERGQVVDLTDPATNAELETYVPLIQQGRGAEVLYVPEG